MAPASLNPVLAANSTSTALAQKQASALRPAGSGVLECAGRDELLLLPYGRDTANQTCKLRVIGWRRVSEQLWIPLTLCTVTATLGTAAGVAGQNPGSSDLFADDIEVNDGIAVEFASADNSPAGVLVPVSGYDYVEVLFSRNGSSVSVNALASLQ